jgi:ketosteroid isomerase-like protein
MSAPDAIDALAQRVALLEAEGAVRRTVARYFAICDALGPDTDLAELGDLFTADAVWEGGGRYRKAFGTHDGRAAIVAMLGSYCGPPAHFALNAHFLASEAIEVTGDQAVGRWRMLQTSTYADGRSDLRSAELTIHLYVDGGRWRIARFNTQNIFSRHVGPWNDEAAISVPPSPPGRAS